MDVLETQADTLKEKLAERFMQQLQDTSPGSTDPMCLFGAKTLESQLCLLTHTDQMKVLQPAED